MRVFASDRRPYVWLLVFCFVAYVGFHAVRARIAPGVLHGSFPSLLTPLAMFSVVEFLPAVRFNSRRSKLIILSLTTAVAAIWLEGIVPHFTDRATGDFADAVAMGIGFAVFWTYDSIVASRRKRSVCGRLVRDFELDPSLRDRVLQSDI